MPNLRLRALQEAGVSIWLDDLSRQRIRSGGLNRLIADDSVTGVTTNPTIFASAFRDLDAYGQDLAAHRGTPTDDAVRSLMVADVTQACDALAPVHEASAGRDGYVSIEVDPRLAYDTQATIDQAARLHGMVNRPNALIKIPATTAGLPAVRDSIAAGVSVNVTLIFSIQRYRQVLDAYLDGLTAAAGAGLDVSRIHSVASFFVSRVDTEVDERLAAIGTPQAQAMLGRAAVANARLAYGAYRELFAGPRFAALAAEGAHPQHPLWASTGTKNPSYSDIKYVEELIAPDCIITMPEKTLRAFGDHGEVPGDTITAHITEAAQVMSDLAGLGIDLDDVFDVLERQGVDKFIASWQELLDSVAPALSLN